MLEEEGKRRKFRGTGEVWEIRRGKIRDREGKRRQMDGMVNKKYHKVEKNIH